MNEMSSCAREEWPAIAMVIFRNYQWGAEKEIPLYGLMIILLELN
jgi:hypothetical protein